MRRRKNRAILDFDKTQYVDKSMVVNGTTILNDFDKSFNNLLWTVAKNWNNENFNTILADIVTNFSKDIFLVI